MKRPSTFIILKTLFQRGSIALCLLSASVGTVSAQQNDSITKLGQRWNLHFQTTVINQSHPAFSASYSGHNSLSSAAENNVSVSTTLFLGAKLWKGAEAYFNPELSGGTGFSSTTGIAGFTNGEIYRVDSPTPKIFIARLYLKQVFALSKETKFVDEEENQLATIYPASYIALYVGKFSIMDFFDCNQYSHDPRSQFYNWALMGNGAYDYPADTRGYTYGIAAELVKPNWAIRFGAVMVATTANGPIMDLHIDRSHSLMLEYEQHYLVGGQSGKIRLIGYFTEAQMGNYRKAIDWGLANNTTPDINANPSNGRTKYGLGLNMEHTFNPNAGMFLRAGWNDGQNESWMFTEIDRHASIGLTLNGRIWGRKEDKLGIAQIVDGISKNHQDFLAAGGHGFIIGDGKLNYAPEYISELYYSFKIPNYPVWLSPDYQFIINPAYNKDRGTSTSGSPVSSP